MYRALVTGATGFIGRHLVARLVELGWEVRCLTRPSSPTESLRELPVQFCSAVLESGEGLAAAVDGCDYVFHLAGITATADLAEMYRVNAAGTWHLAAACARQPEPPALIYVSSLAAAGTSPARRWRGEAERARPISEYGRSKRGGEVAVSAWADRVPTSIVRPGIVFGEYNREFFPVFDSVIRWSIHGVPAYAPKRVALIHQQDLCDLLMLVAQQGQRLLPAAARCDEPLPRRAGLAELAAPAGCGVYFAADPVCPAYAELGRLIAGAVDRRRPLTLHVPEPFLWTAAAVNQLRMKWRGIAQPFNLDKVREATAGHWVCTPSTAHQDLGFQPRASLQERFADTIRWYRQQGWLPE